MVAKVGSAKPGGNQVPRPQGRLPLAAAWMIVFVAVLAHMPALRGYFAQDDWVLLARGAGEAPGSVFAARPFGSFLYWRISWPLFEARSPGYHVTSLLLVAFVALSTARVAVRLGLDRVGASVAGLVAAVSPLWTLPVFWVSATQEVLAVAFALLAAELWLAGGRWRWLALAPALLSFASKEGALGLGIWLALLGWARSGRLEAWRGPAAMTALAALAGLAVWRAIPHAADDAYALGGVSTVARNFALFAGWLLSPIPAGEVGFLRWLGLGVWIGWLAAGWIFWRRERDFLPCLALAWSVLAMLPVVALKRHLYPYYLCSALVGWAWFLGWLAQRAVPARWATVPLPRAAVWSWIAVCAGGGVLGLTVTNAYLVARDATGRHPDPLVQRSYIAAETKNLIQSLPLERGGHLAVLQATRASAAVDTIADVLVGSPVFLALSGPVGLARIVPDSVQVSWASHLDEVPMRAQVLLDDGAPFLRPLGDTSNARIYSALIAVSAGQYARARHDFWNVVGPLGSQVRWAYDDDALPVDASDIRRQAPGFARYLIEAETPADGRILRTFESIYEALLGEKLLQAPWGEPVRG